jgi:hypothetical protein
MPTRSSALAGGLLLSLPLLLSSTSAQEPLPWQRGAEPRYDQQAGSQQPYDAPEAEKPPSRFGAPPRDAYSPNYASPRPPSDDAYRPPQSGQGYGAAPRASGDAYSPPPRTPPNDVYSPPPRPGYAQGPYGQQPSTQGYGQPYSAPGQPYGQPYARPYEPAPGEYYDDRRERRYGSADPGRRSDQGPPYGDEGPDRGYSSREILDTGHGFFGSVSKGLASVVEYAFRKQGRPNGYILGQEAGGAFVAGLRYGEGILYTKDAGQHRVYWQGPSIGYDAGAEGSKVMMLVYNLHDPEEIYQRFGGVDGSAYLVGGIGVTFQQNAHVTVAPIRSGVGLRFGANIGYLKYTRRPTWNPF